MIHHKDKLCDQVCLDHQSIEIFLAESVFKYQKVAYFPTIEYDKSLVKKKLLKLVPNVDILEFPDFDCGFFSNLSPTPKNKTKRISAIYNLLMCRDNNTILLGTLNSLIKKTINIKDLKNSKLILDKCYKLTYDEILSFLKQHSYEKVDFVYNPGEYSIRGEILDIFSPIHDFPVRILFDFEKIENLNLFSTEDQLTKKQISNYELFLPSEFQYGKKNIKCFRELFRKLNIKEKDDFYRSLSDGQILPGSDQFFPILYQEFKSILSYLDNFKFIFDISYQDDFKDIYNNEINDLSELKSFFENDSDFFLKVKDLVNLTENSKILINSQGISMVDNNQKYFSETLQLSKNKINNLSELIKYIKEKNKVYLCVNSISNKNKVKSILHENSIPYGNSFQINSKGILDNKFSVNVIDYEIKSSFILKNRKLKEVIFFSDEDFFVRTVKKNIAKKHKEENLIEDYSNLKYGDYIVHSDHGIGKYNGLIHKKFNDVPQDFIEIIYFGNDKLLIPVENLNVISKYGQSELNVTLDKLGLQNWQQRKATVKKRIRDIASGLLKVAAERELKSGDLMSPNLLEYEKFSSQFEFTETSDQIKSIRQIEDDLSSGKPMDRLICGDVGFGKTEIAMRAAFIAVSSGFQVAIICPKLLLVNQHAETFKKRFDNFSYVIEKISRLESIKKKKQIKEDIRDGAIDILIGTHAIFSGDIAFKNIGLIIIDEEQSFGVEQKEKLKKIKPNCHILTLTATPIPRTLQSSIFQLKNISLIKTPPLSRLNIKTYLMRYDKSQIRKIIQNEIERKGQIFYVAPRINDLKSIEKKLNKIMPELRYDVIHGQLLNKQVEESYDRFFNKKSDLLISTAMIESGLDISNVNTIIIEKPYLFGLAQLYQLRGRVGRSSLQAYAYLIMDDFKNINENSLRKLKIISKINKLGAGLSIATSDLDLRGGGNIVGSEQSGHIKEVGIELYYKMLKEAVGELKSTTKFDEDWSPIIKLGFPISIPENYICDLDLRLNLYRKISNINNTNELNEMLNNLKDRFGEVPFSFKNLFHIIEIKILAKKIFIKKIDNSNKGFVLEFKTDNIRNVEKIIKLVEKNPKFLKLMPESKLFYINSKLNDFERITDLKNLLLILSK